MTQAPPAPVPTNTSELTGAQAGGGAILEPILPWTEAPAGKLNTYREMLGDDTIALGLAMIKAPILAASWSWGESDDAPPDARAFIEDQLTPHLQHYKRAALHGGLVFGWQPFEKVFQAMPWTPPAEDSGVRRASRVLVGLRKIKPLLQDITKILVDKSTGTFAGFDQKGQGADGVTVPLSQSLLFTHDREGDNHHGRPRLENSRKAWHEYNQTARAANRYDLKVAGAYVVVHFPPGKTIVNGQERDNLDIAKELAKGVEASKPICIENKFAQVTGGHMRDLPEKERRQWLIEILGDATPRQDSFKGRLEYQDKKKLRGLFVPERAATEGEHGTKAEAEVHTDIILSTGELLYEQLLEVINWHVVDQLLALNFGEEARGTVYVEPAPLVDRDLAVFKQALTTMLGSQAGFEWVRDNLDLVAIVERLNLPLLPEDQRAESDLVPPGGGDIETGLADEIAKRMNGG